MARAYDSDVLMDEAGNVLVNALGTLYTDSGATTLVSDAYAAASGGSTVTTVTTDASGRWKVWFTTPKSYWVRWSSNGGTAYAANRPTAPLSWTTFTSAEHQAFDAPVFESGTDQLFYVSKGAHASDSNDGTYARPFSTIAAAVAAATAAGQGKVLPLFGTWNEWSGSTGLTIDPSQVVIEGLGTDFTWFDFTDMTSGYAVQVSKANGANRTNYPIKNVSLLGPTNVGNTVDCLGLGSATTYANQCHFDGLNIEGFRRQVDFRQNAWLVEFHKPTMRNATETAWYMVHSTVLNAGENCSVFGGVTLGAGTGVHVDSVSSGAGFNFHGHSFDYNDRDFYVKRGTINCHGCYWEADGTVRQGVDYDAKIWLDISATYNTPIVNIVGGSIVPFYSDADNPRGFAKFTGTAPATPDTYGTLTIDGVSVRDESGQLTVLVYDESTEPTTLGYRNKFVCRGISYVQPDGGFAVYQPLRYRDSAGTIHILEPGADLGDVRFRHTRPSVHLWRRAQTYETIPRLHALNTHAPTSGDLYVVRLPITDGGFRGTTSNVDIALGALGTGVTLRQVGVYTGGPITAPASTLTKFNNATYTNTANTLIGTSIGVTSAGPSNNILWLAALCVTGTSTDEWWGRNVDSALNPLTDPQITPYDAWVGKLTGQATLPASITLSALVNVDFIPWLSLRKTA